MKVGINCLFVILVLVVFLLINQTSERFYNIESHSAKAVNNEGKWGAHWNGGDRVEWIGSWIYPVSSSCRCPDNYDFIDTLCVNRSPPFESSKPKCYDYNL